MEMARLAHRLPLLLLLAAAAAAATDLQIPIPPISPPNQDPSGGILPSPPIPIPPISPPNQDPSGGILPSPPIPIPPISPPNQDPSGGILPSPPIPIPPISPPNQDPSGGILPSPPIPIPPISPPNQDPSGGILPSPPIPIPSPPILIPSPPAAGTTPPAPGLKSFTRGRGWYKNMAQEFLMMHNRERAQEGEPPLKWDRKLARYAREWSETRREDCTIKHSANSYNDVYGENMFWGTGWDWRAPAVVKQWIDEKYYFNRTDLTCMEDMKCGHYTQVVWSSTRRLGCARVECYAGGIIVTCNYHPPGNFMNESPFSNVMQYNT